MQANSKQNLKEFLEANEDRWSQKLILQNLIDLRREAIHLQNKGSERELTSWEHKRIQECEREISELFENCARAGIDLDNLVNLGSAAYSVTHLSMSPSPGVQSAAAGVEVTALEE